MAKSGYNTCKGVRVKWRRLSELCKNEERVTFFLYVTRSAGRQWESKEIISTKYLPLMIIVIYILKMS